MKETKRKEIIIGLFGRKKEKSFEEKVEERLKELNYTRGRFSVENQIRKEEEAVRMAKMRCAIKHQGYINALDYRLNEEVSTRRLKNPAEIERLKNELKRDYFKAEAAICREREEDIQRNREIGLFGRKKEKSFEEKYDDDYDRICELEKELKKLKKKLKQERDFERE